MKAYFEAFGTFGIYNNGEFITRYCPKPYDNIVTIEDNLRYMYPGIRIYWK